MNRLEEITERGREREDGSGFGSGRERRERAFLIENVIEAWYIIILLHRMYSAPRYITLLTPIEIVKRKSFMFYGV